MSMVYLWYIYGISMVYQWYINALSAKGINYYVSDFVNKIKISLPFYSGSYATFAFLLFSFDTNWKVH